MMKKWISTALIAAMLCTAGGAVSAQGNQVGVMIDGAVMQFEQPAVIINSKTMVPLRAIFEELDAEITWDGATQTVTAVRKLDDDTTTTIKLVIGSKIAYRNGHKIELEQAPVIVNSRTMVPVRFVAEALNANVKWDGATRTVAITKFSPLIFAVEKGRVEDVKRLLAEGIDVNLQDDHGDTALSTAVGEQSLEMVQLLLEAGADVNLLDKDQDTALTVAAYYGHLEILEALLATGQVNMATQNVLGYDAVMMAAWQNHGEAVRVLAEAGASVNAVGGKYKRSALMIASRYKALEAAKVLIEAGANVNAADTQGNTPLSLAQANGDAAMVSLLKNAGAK